MRHQTRQLPTRRFVPLVVVVAAVGFTGCGGDDIADDPDVAVAGPPIEAAATDVPDRGDALGYGLVSPQQAADLSAVDGVTVIDVRTPEEFAEGHIDGATMIDFYSATFADEIGALDPSGTYLLYCRSGNRSGQTAILMEQLGFEQVYDLEGGVLAYGAQGLPLVP